MENQKCDLGMIGLGVMGRNFTLNIAEHGYHVAGYDTDITKVNALRAEDKSGNVCGAASIAEFIGLLQVPRAVMMLVPAGAPVDAVIRSLLPYLEPGDVIIDGGNSHYKDTDLRLKTLAQKGIYFMGVGISGGENGARHGPSLMPGGDAAVYERVRPIFEASAAQVNTEPCVAYLGPGSAGHYVKMVHNGIEYGFMQLIAEAYDLMKRGLGISNDELHQVFESWNQSELNAYLIEITANIFREADEKTGQRLIDEILDEAKQKGTGKWASQDAMDLQVPVPTIDAAVSVRDLTVYKEERVLASKLFPVPSRSFRGDQPALLNNLRNALYAAAIITYAQGMALLHSASTAYNYHLDFEAVARIWRDGSIIRAGFLEDLRSAYTRLPGLPNLLADAKLGKAVVDRRGDLQAVIHTAVDLMIPVPGLMASLAYFDSYRSEWLPANLIQAQRDYFGAHTYERIDEKGVFHTHWDAE
jgi:6-phosphogluconate dehydrogenase